MPANLPSVLPKQVLVFETQDQQRRLSSESPKDRTLNHVSVNRDPLLTAEDVAERLRVSNDWVWDHSSRRKPLLPVIRMGDGTLRYRASAIEAFIDERERLSALRRGPN